VEECLGRCIGVRIHSTQPWNEHIGITTAHTVKITSIGSRKREIQT